MNGLLTFWTLGLFGLLDLWDPAIGLWDYLGMWAQWTLNTGGSGLFSFWTSVVPNTLSGLLDWMDRWTCWTLNLGARGCGPRFLWTIRLFGLLDLWICGLLCLFR